jgi:hypothetical protein
LIAEEDCDSRSRFFKGKTADMNEDAEQMEESSEDTGDIQDDSEADKVEKRCEQETGPNEYEQNRQRNIKDLKKRLLDLKEKYPLIPEYLSSTSRQAKTSALNKGKALDVPVVGRESQMMQRNKEDKKSASIESLL